MYDNFVNLWLVFVLKMHIRFGGPSIVQIRNKDNFSLQKQILNVIQDVFEDLKDKKLLVDFYMSLMADLTTMIVEDSKVGSHC